MSSSLSSADDISTQDGPHTLRINQSALLTPPAVLKHQAEQITNARSRAAEGSLAPYTIPLLANTQVRSSKNRVAWTLKFTLPTPAEEGTTRRFSAVPRGYGPSGAQALEGAVRYARPFDYQHEATTLLPNSDFLSLPDHVTQYGPVRAQKLWGCTSQIPLRNGCSHALAGCLLSCGSCLRLSFRLGSAHPAVTAPFLCLTAAPLRRNWVPLRGNDLSAGCCIYLPNIDHLVSCIRPFYFDFISILYTDSLPVT